MNLSTLQKEIVESTDKKIIIIAAAAGGKTRVLTERVRFLLQQGIEASDICAITFTNLAAAEMRTRLAEDASDDLTISTIHGLAARMLTSHGISIGKLISSQKFDEFFPLVKAHPECIKHYKYVLVDEFQDTSNREYEFIFDMIKPDSFFVVGDDKQAIYEGLGANPNLFNRLCSSDDVKVYDLNENYRNGSNILSYAKNIILQSGMRDTSISMNHGGIVKESRYDADALVEYIENTGNFRDWAILCYKNDEVAEVRRALEENFIPTVTFNQGGLSKKQLDDFMNANKVKVLTIWAAKGLEWPNVCICGYNWVSGREHYRVDYVAATRAKNVLLWTRGLKCKRRKYK